MRAKKVLIVLLVFAAAAFLALNLLARRAPDFLRAAIKKALKKQVNITRIDYRFPVRFELEGFQIEEGAPFEGEISFYADQIHFNVSPLSLFRRVLVIDRAEVQNAKVFVRHLRGDLTHALSEAAARKTSQSGADKAGGTAGGRGAGLPLEIRRFELADSDFKYIDYDAKEGGFVVSFDKINGEVRNIALPFSDRKTSYRIAARLLQGRDERPAEVGFSGWTEFAGYDTDANFYMKGVHLPYFQPYYSKVTSAVIEQGYLDSRTALNIQRKDLTGHVDFEIVGLLFGDYEAGGELFGLKADEILSFLKDSAGRLKFQATLRWNLADRSASSREIIRKGIERSLKNTILGSVENILKNTIQKIGEEGVRPVEEDFDAKIKKLKELFRY